MRAPENCGSIGSMRRESLMSGNASARGPEDVHRRRTHSPALVATDSTNGSAAKEVANGTSIHGTSILEALEQMSSGKPALGGDRFTASRRAPWLPFRLLAAVAMLGALLWGYVGLTSDGSTVAIDRHTLAQSTSERRSAPAAVRAASGHARAEGATSPAASPTSSPSPLPGATGAAASEMVTVSEVPGATPRGASELATKHAAVDVKSLEETSDRDSPAKLVEVPEVPRAAEATGHAGNRARSSSTPSGPARTATKGTTTRTVATRGPVERGSAAHGPVVARGDRAGARTPVGRTAPDAATYPKPAMVSMATAKTRQAPGVKLPTARVRPVLSADDADDADVAVVSALIGSRREQAQAAERSAWPTTIAQLVNQCRAQPAPEAAACRRRICAGYWGLARACPGAERTPAH